MESRVGGGGMRPMVPSYCHRCIGIPEIVSRIDNLWVLHFDQAVGRGPPNLLKIQKYRCPSRRVLEKGAPLRCQAF